MEAAYSFKMPVSAYKTIELQPEYHTGWKLITIVNGGYW
jgi:hypothetical protein